MACRIVARRFPRLGSARHHEQVKLCSPARAFNTSTAKAQDDGTMEVRRSSKDQDQAISNQSRASPRSFLPALFSPFYQPASLTHMIDTMERLFDVPSLSSMWGMPSTMRDASSRLPWDVMEDDKSFKLRVDMPGISKEDVKVSVEDRDLVIKAEHDAEKKEDYWGARTYGSYNVRIKLPENVELSGIKAEMKDGVLKVQVPKVEGAKQKQEVPIQ